MPEAEASAETRDHYGVLVGWKHTSVSDRLILQLQTMLAAGQAPKGGIDTSNVVMTHQQATVLANYLLQVAGAQPPPQRRSRLERWFGS
ncbi:hypothetical protein OKA06_17835 [Novosphingobium sp. MW5]|nr:hypothetical protein [Novosphingobium sp. MW5]